MARGTKRGQGETVSRARPDVTAALEPPLDVDPAAPGPGSQISSPASWAPGSYRSRPQTAPQWPRPLGCTPSRLDASQPGSSGLGSSKPAPFLTAPFPGLPAPVSRWTPLPLRVPDLQVTELCPRPLSLSSACALPGIPPVKSRSYCDNHLGSKFPPVNLCPD